MNCSRCNRRLWLYRFWTVDGRESVQWRCDSCDGEVLTTSVRKDGARGYLWVVYQTMRQATDAAVEGKMKTLPHGWAGSRDGACTAAAQVCGGKVAVHTGHVASWLMHEFLSARRRERREQGASRNRDRRDHRTVEYLYGYTGKRYPITKRTKKRVYFVWTDSDVLDPEERITFVAIEELERAKSDRVIPGVYVRNRRGLAVGDWVMTPERYTAWKSRCDEGQQIPTVAECRRMMQHHHPDKGGDSEMFQYWHEQYQVAKAMQETES